MSENQQPLDEEQAVSDVQEQETLPAAAEDTLPAAQDENAPAILDAEPEEEEEDIDPADVKIFGMKRHVFQLTCLGAAVGYILCGLVGILGEKMQGTGLGDILAKSPSATVWAVAVAAVGRSFFVRRRLISRLHASILAWCPESSTSGTSLPRQFSGRVYCGCSSRPSQWLSAVNASSSGRTPGTMRHTASATAIAGISPPVSTKSPMEISSSTHSSINRWSMPS